MAEEITIAGQAAEAAEEGQILQDVARLREVLDGGAAAARGESAGRALLVALSGLPGTGKSYFARELVKCVPFLVLESDRLRKALVPRPKYSAGEHSRVFAASHRLIETYLAQGRQVLFDATNLTESFRRPLYHIADKLGVPLVLVRLTASRETARRRLAERAEGLDAGNNSDADWLVYCRLSAYEEPIQRHHFTADTSGDVLPVVQEIARIASGSG